MAHDANGPSRVFKYLDLNGINKTLETRTIRLTSPLAFNDPFDINLEEAFGGEYEEFHEGLKAAFFEMLCGPMDYSALRGGLDTQKIRMMHDAMQRANGEQREALRRQIMAMPVEQLYPRQRTDEMTRPAVEHLRKGFARFGVFCSAQRSDDLLMWAHYAQKHEGAVIEFRPTSDSMFEASRPVKYSDKRPLMYRTPQDMMRRSYLMTLEQSVREMVFELIFTKSLERTYENEHRLAIPELIDDGRTWTTLPFRAADLAVVYLGCRMPDPDRVRVAELTRQINPQVAVMQAKTHKREYGLEFTNVV